MTRHLSGRQTGEGKLIKSEGQTNYSINHYSQRGQQISKQACNVSDLKSIFLEMYLDTLVRRQHFGLRGHKLFQVS